MDNIEKMQKVLAIQKKVKEIQDLTTEKVDSDCGRVSVTVNGNLQILEIKIIEGTGIDEIPNIFMEITNKAISKVNMRVKQSLAMITQELGLPNMPF